MKRIVGAIGFWNWGACRVWICSDLEQMKNRGRQRTEDSFVVSKLPGGKAEGFALVKQKCTKLSSFFFLLSFPFFFFFIIINYLIDINII
jgi:hypothetical protein